MASFASILVPVEFTQACAVAINRARLIAAEHGAHITLLHVVTAAVAGVPGGTSRASVDQAVARAQASLRRCAAQLAGLDVRATRAVCVGDPVEELSRAAQGADLLVMGAKTSNALRDTLFGAPAERVLRLSRRPVLVTRQPAWGRHRRLVVPVHTAACAQAVAQAAVTLAPDASLYLLHSTNRQPQAPAQGLQSGMLIGLHDRPDEDVDAPLISTAAAQACDVTVSFGNDDLDRLTLRTSDRVGADLIAVPKDEPSSVADFLLGGTARRVLSEGDGDVLLIPRACFPRGDAMLVAGQRSSIAMQAAAARVQREREPAVSAH